MTSHAAAATTANRQGRASEPLGGYALLLGGFAAATAAALVLGRRRIHRLRLRPAEIALLGVATYKSARILTKDRVTAPLRAPFVQNRQPAGHGEVEEDARGTGLRQALGKLVTCPYCAAPYVAAGWTGAWMLNSQVTRLAASVVTMVAVADGLQLAHSAAQQRAG